MSAGKFQQRGREAVGLEVRVPTGQRNGAQGLGAEDQASDRAAIAAHVQQAAAARGSLVPDIPRVVGEVGVAELYVSERADAPAVDQPAQAGPLRVIAHHDCLFDQQPGTVARFDERLDLASRACKWLLAQDMLAGLQGANAPLDVQVVRKGVVDRFDVRVCKQLFVARI